MRRVRAALQLMMPARGPRGRSERGEDWGATGCLALRERPWPAEAQHRPGPLRCANRDRGWNSSSLLGRVVNFARKGNDGPMPGDLVPGLGSALGFPACLSRLSQKSTRYRDPRTPPVQYSTVSQALATAVSLCSPRAAGRLRCPSSLPSLPMCVRHHAALFASTPRLQAAAAAAAAGRPEAGVATYLTCGRRYRDAARRLTRRTWCNAGPVEAVAGQALAAAGCHQRMPAVGWTICRPVIGRGAAQLHRRRVMLGRGGVER